MPAKPSTPPRPDPATPKPPATKPKAPDPDPASGGPKPIVFRGPGVRDYDLKNAKPTADLKAAPGPTIDETTSQATVYEEPGPVGVPLHVLADGNVFINAYKQMRVWDPVKGKMVAEFDCRPGDDFTDFALAGGGRILATLFRRDGNQYLAGFDLREPKKLWEEPGWSTARIWRISTSRDGRRLYVSLQAAARHTTPGVVVHDTATGKVVDSSAAVPSERCERVAFPDDSRVLMTRESGFFDPATLTLWEGSKSGQRVVATLDRKRYPWSSYALAVSPSGKWVAWADATRMLVLSAETGQVRADLLLTGTPTNLAFSKDDRFLAWRHDRGGADLDRACVFDQVANKMVFQVKSNERVGVGTAGFTADGTGFLVGMRNRVYRFDLPAGK